MQTKLSVFCDKVLEAGWLLAVILAPLFFNIHSSRVFEPDKLSLVRSIALVMIIAWLIKVMDGSAWGSTRTTVTGEKSHTTEQVGLWQRISRIPFVLPTILLIGAYVLSTLLSIAPRISLWGSYVRLQGTYTTFSYIVIFFMMLSTMRYREQIDRLCSTIILTSLPISLYGVLQHFNLDSLPWTGDVTLRVAANMGNSIFVAAYLIMAVPITLARVLESFSALLQEQEGDISHALLAGCYTFVMSVQLICIFFTQSRGPWLGLLGGLYVFMLVALISLRRSVSDQSPLHAKDLGRAIAFAIGSIPVGIVPAYVLLVALRRGWRWAWLSWTIHTLLIAAFLVLINLPHSPLSSFRNLPYIGRLGQVFETETGTGKVRVLIWEGALKLITAHPLRTLVGYGPETMHVAYNPFYPPDLAHYEARNASPDRSHNETFDALVITGVIGFLAYMFLFSSIFYYGLKWLGFMGTKQQRNLFLLLSIAGAIVGIFLPKLVEGTYKLSGVGLPVGFIAGTSLYLMFSAAFFYSTEQPPVSLKRRWLLIALLSAIVAHFIEIHFGIAIASTRVHFWVYAAAFVLLGLNRIREEPTWRSALAQTGTLVHSPGLGERHQPRSSKRSRRRTKKHARLATVNATVQARLRDATSEGGISRPSWVPKLLAGSLIVAVMLFTLGFEFIANPMLEIDSLRIIQLSLTTLIPRGDSRTSYGTLWMFLLTWLVGALVVSSEVERSSSSRQAPTWWLSALSIYTATTFTVLLFGMVLHTQYIKPGVDIANTIVFYYESIAILGLLIALALTVDMQLPQKLWRTANLWAYPILVAFVAVAIIATNVTIVKADIYYKQGLKLEEGQRFDAAIQLYNRAIALAPDQDYYYLFLGRAWMGKSSTAKDNQERVKCFEESFKALERARQLNPLNPDHYANLGRLYRNWAEIAATPEERATKLEAAHAYYEQVTSLSPNSAHLYNEWALVYIAKGDFDGALEKLNHSLSLDTQYADTYLILGNFYAAQGKLDEAANAYQQALVYQPNNADAHSALGYIYLEQGNITDALSANLKAIELDPNLARAHSTLGLIYFRLGKLEEAVEENLKVLRAFPNDFISHRNLALLYQQLGRIDEAIAHAQSALAVSPESEKAALQSFIDQLQAQQQATQPQQQGN
nr:tetratricopeptide repeat protein [Chloroflexota bacterium]